MAQYESLIRALTSDPVECACLRAVAAGMENNPMLAGRTEVVLRELARPAPETWPDGREFTPQDCWDYATSFMESSGIPSDLASVTLNLIGDVSLDDVPTEQIEDQALVSHLDQARRDDPNGWFRASPEVHEQYAEAQARLNAPKPPAPSYWTDVDERRLAEIERKHMRAEPGSHEWRDYWQGPLQREYGDLLARKMAPPPAPEPESEPPVIVDHGVIDMRPAP